jgi:hypothetical protein
VSVPLDEFKGRFVRLPVIIQILLVEARIFYRYAVDLVKAHINSIAPVAVRFAYRGCFHRILRLAPPDANLTSRPYDLKDRLPGQARQ